MTGLEPATTPLSVEELVTFAPDTCYTREKSITLFVSALSTELQPPMVGSPGFEPGPLSLQEKNSSSTHRVHIHYEQVTVLRPLSPELFPLTVHIPRAV